MTQSKAHDDAKKTLMITRLKLTAKKAEYNDAANGLLKKEAQRQTTGYNDLNEAWR